MSESKRRVVVTGVGLVTPMGRSPEAFWESLCTRKSGVRPLTQLPVDVLPTRVGGEIPEFTGHIDDFGLNGELKKTVRKGLKVMCREIQMGVAAAQLALKHAQLVLGKYDPDRTGVSFGSDYIMTSPDEFIDAISACMSTGQFEFDRWAEHGMSKVTPLWLLKYLPNMPASHIAIYNDLRGPNNSITQREASGNLAIAEAYCTIQRGEADSMVAGATGTRLHPLRSLHAVLQEQVAPGDGDPETISRPFDTHRAGMVLGEGAASLVLEELNTALGRGVPILAEIVGYGASAAWERSGIARCDVAIANALQRALQTAGWSPDDVGHLSAHGLATQRADHQEARGIQQVFGTRKTPVPITAVKGNFGNLGAGSGVAELIASILALGTGQLFPTVNCESPDPECPVTVAREGTGSGDSFLKISVTPQAQASVLALQRFAG